MIRISSLSVPLDYNDALLASLAAKRLGVSPGDIRSLALVKRSVDAREKQNVHFVCTLDVAAKNDGALLQKKRPNVAPCKAQPPFLPPQGKFPLPPVVVGAGPAGLFAALILAQAGARPIVLERGKPVDLRQKDVDRMFAQGLLDPQSNVQFGEGGAGAFSDGKLTTGIKNPYQKTVLDTFLRHGAPEEIIYLAKPHIGTDRLKGVVSSIRREILALGGQVLFETALTGIETKGNVLTAVKAQSQSRGLETIPCQTLILAIGHSARDTFQALFHQGVAMEQKPFAIGARIEHPQGMVDASQYGSFAGHPALGAADYKLNVHTPSGRGAYTFCMCPGGQVVAAASQPGGVVTNGMSYHARDGRNANAALLVGVRPGDFGSHPLGGLAFQQRLEQAAYQAGGGGYTAPCQRVEDFLSGRASAHLGSLVIPSYRPGVVPADLRACLPEDVIEDMRLGIRGMGRQLKGFDHPDALLTGVETRSSSPVRILRDQWGQSNIRGLYPAGEGAGYAGGIVSAGADGIAAAMKAVQESLAP